MNYNLHNFYIPVMGVSFTIDTPAKVAQYGISSVIPLADDKLIEQMREHYCSILNLPFQPITEKQYDYRAKRITEYLNLVNFIVENQTAELKEASFENCKPLNMYFQLLPDNNELKIAYEEMLACAQPEEKKSLADLLKSKIKPGRIDVNIMTKIDGMAENANAAISATDGFAHSALRGFASSNINGSVIFSAGMNPRLYTYIESFKDFYPDQSGFLKKEIILKVSDFRSAQVQGSFLAKKGLWISEYRIESGLNCGGHAFATDGYLMGPILEEFKNKKAQLAKELTIIYKEALSKKGIVSDFEALSFTIGAQGGIGTSKENEFLLNYYNIDATGWGTPFLLVPEATTVDKETLNKLVLAKSEDLYLSNVSPLGVPINNLRGNAKDAEKIELAAIGKPGSPCIKHFLKFNTEFTEKPICTASIKFQKLKIEQIQTSDLSDEIKKEELINATEKVCLCEGLGASAIINNHIPNKGNNSPFICPGPNLAYFSKVSTLEEMVNHIYGRMNILSKEFRHNMFINELKMYIDYYFDKVANPKVVQNPKRTSSFRTNLLNGIEYYKELVTKMKNETLQYQESMMSELYSLEKSLLVYA